MTQEEKKKVFEELIKCRQSPVYFLEKYAKIQEPLKGLIKFTLFPYQKQVLNAFLEHRFNIILKGRQIGMTTLVAGYAAWRLLFFQDQDIMFLSIKQETAKEIVLRIETLLSHLPDFMIPQIIENNKLSIRLANRSRVRATTTTTESARSPSLSLLVIDECAHIRLMNEVYTSALPSISQGGDFIALSTPAGSVGWFYEMWKKAKNGEVTFNPIELPWNMHPSRDENWKKEMLANIGIRRFSQEYDANFVYSGSTVISPEYMEYYRKIHVREPISKANFDHQLWIWERPDYHRRYLVCGDSSRGDAKDYSALHVVDIEKFEQVAEYKGKLTPDLFGHFLVEVAVMYNDALLVVEDDKGYGYHCIQKILDRGYKNLYWHDQHNMFINPHLITNPSQDNGRVPGFPMSSKTRLPCIQRLEEDMREEVQSGGGLVIHSERFLEECRTFIYNLGRPEAAKGENDDLFMAMAILCFVRATSVRLIDFRNTQENALISTFSHQSNEFQFAASRQNTQLSPYVVPGVGDVSWLINK